MTVAVCRVLQPFHWQQSSLAQLLIFIFTIASSLITSCSFIISRPVHWIPKSAMRHPLLMTNEMITEESTPTTPQWDPILQIYVDGIVPENAKVQTLIEQNNGYLRLFGYGSLCWNPGTGALSQPGVKTSLGRARGYKRCWAQKSTDHRGRPEFPGIVCTLLEDEEVRVLHSLPPESSSSRNGSVSDLLKSEPTMTEGVIYLIPPEWVQECLDELDFREKGGYARDVIDVVEDDSGDIHQALLYRGTPDNPAFWSRAILDLPLAAAVISVAEGPSGKNDVYLNSLDRFLSDTHTIEAENDDTTTLANMVRYFQTKSQLYFLFGSGSNQHNQLLLDRPNNAALLQNNGEDAHEQKEIVLCTPQLPEDGHDQENDKPAKLFAGGGHSGLLSSRGKLYLWGWNGEGQCGTGVLKQGIEDPLPVVEPLSDMVVETAALGFNHTLVIEKGTGKVYAFGSNERGQVTGIPSTTGRPFESTPFIPDCLKDVHAIAVAAGLFHSAVLTDSGELVTFGNGQFGQSLVNGRWKPDDGSRLVCVACGRRHTVVADEHGRVWTFGENKYGQLGRSIEGKKYDATPTLVEGIPTFSAQGTQVVVDCGWSHTIVHVTTASSGESFIFGWGRNDKGQLGLGTRENVLSPISLFGDKTIRLIACGSECTMLVDGEFRILGCGWNEHGNLATNGTEDNLYLVETKGARVVGPPALHHGPVTIAVGGAHYLAAKVMTSS